MSAPFSISFNLPWQAAIDQAQSRGVLLPEAYYALPDALKGQAQTISGMTRLDQIQRVHDAMTARLKDGGTFAQFQKEVDAQNFGLNKNHLDLVFRNAVQNAYQAGHWRNFEANKSSRGYLMYSAVNDGRTRPAHRALSGIIRPVDDEFWQTHSPPCGHRCFLPDTKVGGRFEIGLKAFYSGVAVEIITSNGNRLAVTANHPILTRQGMIRADEVQQGFDLVTDCRDVDAIAAFRDINNEQLPSRADEVFDALSLEAFGLAQATSFDLYGDAAFIKGDVQVVGRKGALMYGFKPAPFKFVNKRILNWANHFSGTFANDCINKSPLLNAMSGTLARLLRRCGDYLQYAHSFKHCAFSNPIRTRHSVAAVAQRCAFNNGVIHTNQYPRLFSSLPCRAALAFYRCAVSLKCRPFNLFGITSPSDRDPRIKQKDAHRCASNPVLLCRRFFAHAALIISNRCNWNRLASLNTRQGKEFSTPTHGRSAPLKASIDGSVAATELLRNLINGQAAQVKFAQVLSVRQFHYSGHVYDFQTDNGLIIAEGIYTSNCRCTLISLTEAQAKARSPNGEGLNKSSEGLQADKGWGYKPLEQGERLNDLMAKRLAQSAPAIRQAWNESKVKHLNSAQLWDMRGNLDDCLSQMFEKLASADAPACLKANPSQPTWEDLKLPDLRALKSSHSVASPALLQAGQDANDALRILRGAIGIKQGESILIQSPVRKIEIADWTLNHIVEKRIDTRERYANLIRPTLEHPLEIWSTEYEDGFRERYIKLFDAKKNLFVVVRVNQDGSLLWNIMQKDLSALNAMRMGNLVFKVY